MLPLILFGLLAVVSVTGEGEQLDFSGGVRMPNHSRWLPPGYSASPEVDSSEHGVTQGKYTTTCKCGWANRANRRIVGGKVHAPNEYPFIAGVAHAHQPNYPHCGSAIISPWHILTAAHCTYGAQSLVVTLGDYDRSGRSGPLQHIPVLYIVDHPQYDNQTLRNDISLLVLQWPINQNEYVGVVCMPTFPMNIVGEHVRFIGWGARKFNSSMTTLPQKVDTRVVDMYSCHQAWQIVLPNPATQICTHSRGKTPCQGDSGGPVVYLNPQTNRYVLVGLVSFGPHCKDDVPSVQTYVPAYLPWINNIIQTTTPNQQICS